MYLCILTFLYVYFKEKYLVILRYCVWRYECTVLGLSVSQDDNFRK